MCWGCVHNGICHGDRHYMDYCRFCKSWKYNPFEVRARVDVIYRCPIIKWSAETWLYGRATGEKPLKYQTSDMPICIYSGICDVYSFALLKSIHCHTAIQHHWPSVSNKPQQKTVKCEGCLQRFPYELISVGANRSHTTIAVSRVNHNFANFSKCICLLYMHMFDKLQSTVIFADKAVQL